jgi:hypothetical protein
VAPNGNLYVSSEGNFSTDAAGLFQPFVREIRLDGSFVRDFETPAAFNYVDNTTSGGRSNKLFEALAVTPDGSVFTANEDALVEDGPLTTLAAGSAIRVLKLDPATGKSGAQYAYQLPKIPLDKAASGSFPPDNGLPELLAVSNSEFIAIERAFADGVGNTIRLTRATIEPDTTDVRSFKSLVGASYKPMKRELLLEMPVTYRVSSWTTSKAFPGGRDWPTATAPWCWWPTTTSRTTRSPSSWPSKCAPEACALARPALAPVARLRGRTQHHVGEGAAARADVLAHGLGGGLRLASADGGHHGLVLLLRARQPARLLEHAAPVGRDAQPQQPGLLHDEIVAAGLVYQFVQLHVGLHIAFGIIRPGACRRVCQRRLQPLAQLHMDARGGQPGQHAFQLGQAFHHGHQFARIQAPHIDARANWWP